MFWAKGKPGKAKGKLFLPQGRAFAGTGQPSIGALSKTMFN